MWGAERENWTVVELVPVNKHEYQREIIERYIITKDETTRKRKIPRKMGRDNYTVRERKRIRRKQQREGERKR